MGMFLRRHFLFTLLSPTVLFAQEAPPQESAAQEGTAEEGSTGEETAPPSDSEAVDEKASGEVRVIVFVEGTGAAEQISAEGARVEMAGLDTTANENGSAVVTAVPPGEHELKVTFTGSKSGPVLVSGVVVVAGNVTQVLLTVDGAGTLVSHEIEAPEAAAAALAAETKPEVATVPGTIRGRVMDSETKKPISGVQIYVRGREQPLVTSEAGEFSVEAGSGLHDLSILHSGYASVTKEGVEVRAKEVTDVEIVLSPSSAELDDMVITEPFVEGGVSSAVAEERESTAVQDIIGAEQMSKSGDSDASAALGRVTGLTVVDGKFVYVRGMGERYSSTLLNGAQVPSPEPERRVVPLNLFPTAVLESMVVQKTYSPDMPGEFGGGVVELRTRTFPEEFLFNVGVSGTVNTATTFRNAPSYQGGKTDFLGFDDGGRARSEELAEESKRGEPLTVGNRFEPGLTQEEVLALGRTLPNNWNTRNRTIPPDGRINLAVGNTHRLGKVPVGYVVAGQYENSWEYQQEERRTVQTANDEVLVATDYDIKRATNTVGITGMLGLGATLAEGQKLFSNTMIFRTTDNTTTVGEGQGLEGGELFTRLRFVERQLLTQQFRGEHVFAPLSNLQLDWRFVYSLADREEPDRRDYRYDFAPDLEKYVLSVRGGAVERFYSELDDKIFEGGADLTLPISWTQDLVTAVSGGAMLLSRKREVNTYRYQYRVDGYEPVDERTALREEDLETILDPENLRVDGVGFEEATAEDEPYDATQTIRAGYGKVETPLGTKALQLMAGVRYEQSKQGVESVNAEADLNTGDVLPAGTLTWAFVEDMQLRGGISKTVSRPDFRELSLARFFDVETSTEIVGNPDLKRAIILNYDARYEWYFSGDESVSLAGFYKNFNDPIETVVLSSTARKQSWQNADSAQNVGIEIEARKRLGFITEPLDSFFVAGNISFIRSQVKLDTENSDSEFVNTSSERPLEGQSPYVLNLQLGYDDAVGADGNLSATVLFNIAGRRIAGVGANGAPDIYEEPIPRLDFVTRHRVDEHWVWGFKAQNLLNPERVMSQGTVETRSFRSGVSFNLSASYTY